MSINLEGLNPNELDALIQAAAEQKKRLHKNRLNDVRAKLVALARDEGYSIEELFGEAKLKAPSPRAGRTVAPKYRNPAESSQTWTGRGKKPRWVQAALDGGKSMADLAI